MRREYQRRIPAVRIYHEYAPHFSEALYLVTCGFEQCGNGASVGPMERPDWHLHMILSGEGNVEVGENTYHLQAGQMFLVKHRERIRYYADEINPWAYCWVAFGGENAALYMNQAGFVKGVNAVASPVEPGSFLTLADELLAHTGNDLSDGLWRFGLLNQMIGMTIKPKRRNTSEATGKLHTAEDYIDYTLEFIEQNYIHAKVSDIADSIGIDRGYLASLFKKATGLTPREYMSYVRISKSVQLLLNTNMPISEVARQVGFGSPLTFSKCFKKELNASPQEYRLLPEHERPKLPAIKCSGSRK